MYRLAGWQNETICRIVSREMILGISSVFGLDPDAVSGPAAVCKEEICRLFLHQCDNKHVFDTMPETSQEIDARVRGMIRELQDETHTYVFDAIGTLILYFCINTCLENSQDSGIEWVSSISEEDLSNVRGWLENHMKDSLSRSGLHDAQIRTLLRGYIPALGYIISHFTEYNSELGIGSYADILTENVIYHNYDFLHLADHGAGQTSSHFPEGYEKSYAAVTGSAQYPLFTRTAR